MNKLNPYEKLLADNVGVARIASTAFIIALLSIGGILGLLHSSNIQVYQVMSGSMEPVMYKGDIVFVSKEHQALAPGDIAVYRAKWRPSLVIHRITKIDENGNFIFKGDANNTEDPYPVSEHDIVGEVLGLSTWATKLFNRSILFPLSYGMIFSLSMEALAEYYNYRRRQSS